MEQAILEFGKQFAFEPEIKNAEKLPSIQKFLICGMGGSALPGDILREELPSLDIRIHRDYDLPTLSDITERLIIATSYSGNTEETVSSLEKAQKSGFSVAVITTGGTLLQIAKESGLPYIEIPETGIQPRMALGFLTIALLKMMAREDIIQNLRSLKDELKPAELKTPGNDLAQTLHKHIPIIYASERNCLIAYNWKIKLNETGKVPAFYNIFPELNHNEMTGFDHTPSSAELSEKFSLILIEDDEDDLRLKKRFSVTKKLLSDKGLATTSLLLQGKHRFEKLFSSLLLADWTAYHLALLNQAEPEQVPLVEGFKKLLK